MRWTARNEPELGRALTSWAQLRSNQTDDNRPAKATITGAFFAFREWGRCPVAIAGLASGLAATDQKKAISQPIIVQPRSVLRAATALRCRVRLPKAIMVGAQYMQNTRNNPTRNSDILTKNTAGTPSYQCPSAGCQKANCTGCNCSFAMLVHVFLNDSLIAIRIGMNLLHAGPMAFDNGL